MCYCTVRQMITLHILQYSYNILKRLATVCCCTHLYKLYCSGRLEVVHKRNDCSYTICTEMVLQWHCLLCSTAIHCCSAFRHKQLDTERSVTSNTDRIVEPNIGHSSGLRLHTTSCNLLSPKFEVSVYIQLYVTNCHPQFRSLSTYSFM